MCRSIHGCVLGQMVSRSEYVFRGIDFSGVTILDAGTGAGNTTMLLARKLEEAGGKGRIISVDIDPATFPSVKERLGDLARFVEFVKADLTSMPQIESGSIDIVVCTATLCALNDRPLKALRGLSEFYRVLKKGGWLIFSEEYPLPKATRPEEEVQVLRWQMYKSIAELLDGEHWTEIYPEELELAASLVGFKNIEWRRFEGGPLKRVTMEEWKEVMPEMIRKIDDKQLQKAFMELIQKIWDKFEKEGGVESPFYVMRMRK